MCYLESWVASDLLVVCVYARILNIVIFISLHCSAALHHQVMSLIVAANRDCLEEVRVLETAETDARAYALHALTSLRMVRAL